MGCSSNQPPDLLHRGTPIKSQGSLQISENVWENWPDLSQWAAGTPIGCIFNVKNIMIPTTVGHKIFSLILEIRLGSA